jgi:hypothetical protein
MTYEKKKNEVW